jgi:hypothetical protein
MAGNHERLRAAATAPPRDVDVSSPEASGAPITGTPLLVHKLISVDQHRDKGLSKKPVARVS